MKTQLEVGDKIVVYSYGKVSNLLRVDRVTKTQAFAGVTKFKRDYNGSIRVIGVGSFVYRHYRLYDAEKHDVPLKRLRLKNKLKKLLHAFDDFTDSQIAEIYDFLETNNY